MAKGYHRWSLINICHLHEGNQPDWRRPGGSAEKQNGLCLRTSALALDISGFESKFRPFPGCLTLRKSQSLWVLVSSFVKWSTVMPTTESCWIIKWHHAYQTLPGGLAHRSVQSRWAITSYSLTWISILSLYPRLSMSSLCLLCCQMGPGSILGIDHWILFSFPFTPTLSALCLCPFISGSRTRLLP